MIKFFGLGIGLLIGIIIALKSFGRILDLLIEGTGDRGFRIGSFKTHMGVGRKSTPAIEKAAIARVGLGANDSSETIYWNAFTDSDDQELNSSSNYQIKFNKLPDVMYEHMGFWSLTVYGADKFLVPNEDYKYMLGSRHPLKKEKDGSFSIYLSRNKPSDEADWLPLPARDEKFSLALRCYVPGDSMTIGMDPGMIPLIIKLS